MDAYRVTFFKLLTSSNGKTAKVCQRAVDIHSARDRDRAIRAAKSRFAHLEGVGDWKLHADIFEVVPLSVRAAWRSATRRQNPPRLGDGSRRKI